MKNARVMESTVNFRTERANKNPVQGLIMFVGSSNFHLEIGKTFREKNLKLPREPAEKRSFATFLGPVNIC